MQKLLRSLRFRMCVFLALLFVCVAALLLYNNLSAADILRDEVCAAARDVLIMSRRQLDDMLGTASSSLASVTYLNEDVPNIQTKTPDTTDFHVAMERVKRRFTNASYGSLMDSFFYYDPARQLYFANENDITNPVRKAFAQMDANEIRQKPGKWFSLRTPSGDYLVRLVHAGSAYIGAFVNVQSALAQVHSDTFADSQTYLLDSAGVFLTADAPETLPPPGSAGETGDFTFVDIGNERFLWVAERVSFGDFSLVTLIPDAEISSRIGDLSTGILLAGVLAFVIFSFGALLIRHWILLPTRRLTQAVQALQAGDFSTALPPPYEEFDTVYKAFRQATETIEQLKIDMYEERLRRQKVRMQYLQMQVAPHFLINCLNTVYQLTDTNNTALTHVLLQALSKHLRYTLSASETVRLLEELEHVENFATLSSVRYPDVLTLVIQCPEELKEATVCPLMVLGFVENTIKYEAAVGKRLSVHVEIERKQENGVDDLHIRVWDTGGGFDPNILEDLQDINRYIDKYGDAHIGIGNILQRAEILFERCRFAFCNRQGAGAQIDVQIPFIRYTQGKERAHEPAGR